MRSIGNWISRGPKNISYVWEDAGNLGTMSKLRFLGSIKQNQLWPVLPHVHRWIGPSKSILHKVKPCTCKSKLIGTYAVSLKIIITPILRNNVSRLQSNHYHWKFIFSHVIHVCRLTCSIDLKCRSCTSFQSSLKHSTKYLLEFELLHVLHMP